MGDDEFAVFRELIDGLSEENERQRKLIEGLKIAKENSSNDDVTKQINNAIKHARDKFLETGNFKKLESELQRYIADCSLEKWEKVKEKLNEMFKDVNGINVEKLFNESRDYMLRILETSNVVNTEIDDVECGGWIVKSMTRLYLDAFFPPGTDIGSSFRFKYTPNQKTADPKTSEKRKKTIFDSSDESDGGENDNKSTPVKKKQKLFMKTGACSVITAKHVEEILMDDINKTFEEIIEILLSKDNNEEIKKLETSAKFKFYVNNLKNKIRRESIGTPSTTKK
jgi:hypothetical protein